ncbi:MAG: YcxB family protein [Bacteroidia bacterium]
MTYQIKLELNDYLTHQLYSASISERVKKRKRRSWILFPAALFILGIVFVQQDNGMGTGYFIAGVIWAIGYPFYFKWTYKRHFAKYVKDNFSQKAGQIVKLKIGDDYLFSKDEDSEAKIRLHLFHSFVELPEHILLRTNKGDTLIIPKSMLEYDQILKELKEKAREFNIEWNKELDWKW